VINWDDLRIFLAAANAGSLAGAARDLGVKHTTVGRRLDALEESLGVRLFLRDRTGLTLTDAGADVARRSGEIAETVAAIERTAPGTDEAITGTVRVTTSESFTGFLVRHLVRLRTMYPELVVEVLTTNAEVDLLSRKADFALRFRATSEPGLVQRRVGEMGWALYASKTYLAENGRPASAADLSGHRIVGYDTPMAGVPGALWLAEHAGDSETVMRADSLVAVLNATAMGMGLSVLPCFMAAADANLVRLTDDVLGARVAWLVAHPDVARIPRVRKVIDFVIAMMKEEDAFLSGRLE
jgi:DNA-binding transcriptional LysR family regulator